MVARARLRRRGVEGGALAKDLGQALGAQGHMGVHSTPAGPLQPSGTCNSVCNGTVTLQTGQKPAKVPYTQEGQCKHLQMHQHTLGHATDHCIVAHTCTML